MGFRLKRMPQVQNVAANSTANITNLPLGFTYNSMQLLLGGTAFVKSDITEIRLRLGGKTIWTVEGSHIDTINKYNRQSAAATLLHLPFQTPNAKTAFGHLAGGIDTSLGYNSFAIEVDISGATAPTLEIYADVAPPKPAPKSGEIDLRPIFRAIQKSTHSLASAAKHDLRIPLGSQIGNSLRQLHLFHANITEFEVKKDNDLLQEVGAIATVQGFQNMLNRVTQSGHFCYDPVLLDFQGEAELTTRLGNDDVQATWEFFATTSGADTVDAYTDLYTDINRI